MVTEKVNSLIEKYLYFKKFIYLSQKAKKVIEHFCYKDQIFFFLKKLDFPGDNTTKAATLQLIARINQNVLCSM